MTSSTTADLKRVLRKFHHTSIFALATEVLGQCGRSIVGEPCLGNRETLAVARGCGGWNLLCLSILATVSFIILACLFLSIVSFPSSLMPFKRCSGIVSSNDTKFSP